MKHQSHKGLVCFLDWIWEGIGLRGIIGGIIMEGIGRDWHEGGFGGIGKDLLG